jgi:hypothetical protein
MYREAGDELGATAVLNNIGAAHNGLRHFHDALKVLTQANSYAMRTGDDELLAIVFSNTGFSHTRLRNTQEARQSYREALAGFKRTGDWEHQSDMIFRLGRLESSSRKK